MPRPQTPTHQPLTGPPTPRRYPVTIRNEESVEYTYAIEGDALEAYSLFFKAARSQCWTKADVLTVLDENPEVFRSYVELVCYGQEAWKQDIDASIAQSNLHPTDGTPVPPAIACAREKVFDDLIGVYILTDQFVDPTSANFVIDQMIRFSKETCLVPHLEAINQAYNSTLEGSPLRNLLRDWFVHEALPSTVEALARSDVHAEFLADMAIENCKLKSDHKQGTIRKWFYQAIADRPEGVYHQPILEAVANASEIVPTGSIRQHRIVWPDTEDET